MKRPVLNSKIIAEVSAPFCEEMENVTVEDIVANYCEIEGWLRIVERIEKSKGVRLSTHEAAIVDMLWFHCSYVLTEYQWQWAKEYDIQPDLPLGTTTTEGIITGISGSKPASYAVKRYGQVDTPGHVARYAVPFEEAIPCAPPEEFTQDFDGNPFGPVPAFLQ